MARAKYRPRPPRGVPPSAEEVRRLFSYDPETGLLRRRVSAGRWRAGEIAGYVSVDGYVSVGIRDHAYRAHRLAWLIMTGEWPVEEVDHRDLNRANNRWSNLRAATRAQNQANLPAFSTNTSGYKGVCWCSRTKRWKASIFAHGHHKHLGYFDDPTVAAQAYEAFATELRGEFARAA